MESVKAEAVAGEGKAVTSERFRYEEESCGALQREEAEIGKNDFRGARWQGARRFGTQCSERLHARGEQGWKSGHLEPFPFARSFLIELPKLPWKPASQRNCQGLSAVRTVIRRRMVW